VSNARYAGRFACLVTKHGKERAIARPLRAALGLIVKPTADIDTDMLGTFLGDVPRPGAAPDVALVKARMGLSDGAVIALASEGSFGPHPTYPFLARGVEHIAFIDAELRLELVETASGLDTNFAHVELGAEDSIAPFLKSVGFPQHGVIVRSAEWQAGEPYDAGIVDAARLAEAVSRHRDRSPAGRIRLDTDMRAHLNPTRMRAIRRLAFRLARRLACSCPSCGTPGFGQSDVVRGLTCLACGTPTDLVAREVWACVVCGYREERPRADGRVHVEPDQCPMCNP
jgi:ribosomal protein L37E